MPADHHARMLVDVITINVHPEEHPMPYASVSTTAGLTVDDYRAVSLILGPQTPSGLILETAGDTDAGLHVISVWNTKQEHDEFLQTRLMPAFQAAALRPGQMSVTDIDIAEITGQGVPDASA
jgi:hypothetical protein